MAGARLADAQYEHFLLVGNQAQHRTSFMVINLIPFKTERMELPSLRQIGLGL